MSVAQDYSQAAQPSKPPCVVCYDLDPAQAPDYEELLDDGPPVVDIHWFRARSVMVARSSRAGCHFCYIIDQAYRRFGLDRIRSLDPEWNRQTMITIYFDKALRLGFISDNAEELGYFNGAMGVPQAVLRGGCELFVKPDKLSPWPVFKPAHEVSPVLHSNRRQKVVKGWLSTCTAQHERCSKPFCNGKYDTVLAPKRLLDLGNNPRNGVKLVDASSDTKPYAAVVHSCTEDLEPPLAPTTRQNLEERRLQIQWWQIPKAIQEALVIAHEQGIRYVWVKDFFVLQDDTEDILWHTYREDIIYRGSFLTIAITGLKDLRLSSFGPRTVISDRAVLDKTPECFPIPVNHRGRDYTIYARDSMHHAHRPLIGERHHYGRRTRNEMIAIFGNDTCFQAIALSPRVLHLRNSEMVWECQEDQRCECMAETHNYQRVRCTWNKIPQHLGFEGLLVDEVFRGIIRLPYETKDRQMALSAFFRHISQLSAEAEDPDSRVDCFAGIPISQDNAKSLPYELLWSIGRLENDGETEFSIQHSYKPETPTHHSPMRPKPCYAPSWSWTSMQFSKGEKLLTADDICWPSTVGETIPDKDFRFKSLELISRDLTSRHHVIGSTSYSTDVPLPSDEVFKPYKLHLEGKIMPVQLDWNHVKVTGQDDDMDMETDPMLDMSIKHMKFTQTNGDALPGAEFRPDCDEWVERYCHDPYAREHIGVVILLLGTTQHFDDYSGEATPMDVGLVLSEIIDPSDGQPVRERIGVFSLVQRKMGLWMEDTSWFDILKIEPTAVSIS